MPRRPEVERLMTTAPPASPAPQQRRVAVIGGGITGAAAAFELSQQLSAGALDQVEVFERADSVGGRSQTSPFAGLDHVDCGPDAFLARVPDAVALATEVGLGAELTHPQPVGAAVWHHKLHDIPAGLVLGVPGNPFALAQSGLLSWRGKARAAIEPFLPRTSTDADAIGPYVRARFGHEVHERLVDALVGSIYATDTDRFSLAEMPQVAALTAGRSMLLTARRTARRNAGTATAGAAPIFATPKAGVQTLVTRTFTAAQNNGVVLHTGRTVSIELVDQAHTLWMVDGEPFDAVVLAVPAATAATLVSRASPPAAALLALSETADVALLTLHVDEREFPEAGVGKSGYLIPKPVQRHLTAVSFGSQKWGHWQPPEGGQILRASLGRDGAPVLHLDDDDLVDRALDDLAKHLGSRLTPREVRVSRWPGAFAQYRPHHRAWVDSVRSELPAGLFLAGSSFDGIGLPACIRSGRTNAENAALHVKALAS
jgi:oxygen-dependent protoporphyrinogen oxidase